MRCFKANADGVCVDGNLEVDDEYEYENEH